MKKGDFAGKGNGRLSGWKGNWKMKKRGEKEVSHCGRWKR
jgi:hypothetical protein